MHNPIHEARNYSRRDTLRHGIRVYPQIALAAALEFIRLFIVVCVRNCRNGPKWCGFVTRAIESWKLTFLAFEVIQIEWLDR